MKFLSSILKFLGIAPKSESAVSIPTMETIKEESKSSVEVIEEITPKVIKTKVEEPVVCETPDIKKPKSTKVVEKGVDESTTKSDSAPKPKKHYYKPKKKKNIGE